MPVELNYSKMDCDVSPRGKQHGIERTGSEDSGFGSRSRNSNLDDDFMNYMSHEEQECILFFETTLDSLKDDFEESSSVCSVKSEDPSTPTQIHSGNEEIIDLVVAQPQATERVTHYENVFPVEKDISVPQKEEVRANQEKPQPKQPESPRPMTNTAPFVKQRSFERSSPESENASARALYNSVAKPPGSVPTPMVIAQKIAEKKVGATSPVSPPESKRFTYESNQMNPTSPTEGRELHYRNAKLQRFPSNISISMASRDYNNTITKAAVKVQERKAQVLANLGGTSLLVAELDDQQQKAKPRRCLSFKEAFSIQTRDEVLPKLGLVEESDETDSNTPNGFKSKIRNSPSAQSMKVPSVTNGTHTTAPPPVTSPLKAPSPPKPEPKEIPHLSTKLNTSGINRSRSIQKPSGFRSQGVTVQFSGRGSTDESRKEALRKLGLLRVNQVQ